MLRYVAYASMLRMLVPVRGRHDGCWADSQRWPMRSLKYDSGFKVRVSGRARVRVGVRITNRASLGDGRGDL